MEFLEKQIAPPATWEVFEDLARALFAAVWEDPHAQKNGRSGQAQHGVDVYGEPKDRPGAWHGVQCKGKTRAYGAKATKREFDAELLKAETFSPNLSHWIFATTAPTDGVLQKHAREVSTARVAAGKFPINILGWDSLLALLDQHPAVIRQFYPEHVSPVPDAIAILARASKTSLKAIEDVLSHGDTSLSLIRADLWGAARETIEGAGILRLTGDGGTGKSGLARRLAETFEGPVLVLKDNRTTATSLQQHFAQLGVVNDIDALFQGLTESGSALCLIDGADRLLMSDRRGVVTDLLTGIAESPLRDRWTIVTTARSFQEQDLVATALKDAGFDQPGRAVHVGSIDDADAELLGNAFPAFAPLLGRDDLADQNRSLFLLRELLQQDPTPSRSFTEVDIGAAWANARNADANLAARRSKALSELGRKLVAEPSNSPARAEFDSIGLQTLIEEGTVLALPTRDTVTMTYDVHEDWLLARSLDRERARLPALLRAAGEPLWWQRAMRLAGQILLEGGDEEGWLNVLATLDGAGDLDPAWARAMLVAPLYSERAPEVLPTLQSHWLADDARLLARLLDTLIVFETRIDEDVLASPALAHLDETQRYTLAAYWKQPIGRSWAPFLRWSLPLWESWPPALIPRLADIAHIFTRATARIPNSFGQAIARICVNWLREIEDAQHCEIWDDRREPFGINLARDRWKEIEEKLRETLSYTVDSAPRTVAAYLKRLGGSRGLEEPRSKLIEAPARIPSLLPAPWVDMCLAHFVPHRRTRRPGPGELFGAQLFPWHSYRDAGIRGGRGFFPSSPLRGGFADLFEGDEGEALRLLHRLEMRASVFWRWYSKCEDRRRPLPTVLTMPWGDVQLWGDEAVYRWSRGILGSNVLGSAYLALDDWLSAQAEKGRPAEELVRLALQNNGLIACAAPCIAMLIGQVNAPGAIDLAGPFLAEPRLWNFDIKRHIDDQGSAHRIGFQSRESIHFSAVERLHQRRSAQQPLSHALLLPFRLKAGEEAQDRFDSRRAEWRGLDLASYLDELDDADMLAGFEARIERCLSDSDPAQIEFESVTDQNQIRVSIAPPAEALAEIAAMAAHQERLGGASRLTRWVDATRAQGRPSEDLSIQGAIDLAKVLEEAMKTAPAVPDFDFAARIAGAGIVGAAAVAARHGAAEQVEAEHEWIEHWLSSGARIRHEPSEAAITIDEAILPFDVQVLAAWGLAGMACRNPGRPEIDGLVIALVAQRLHDVSEAALEGLLWDDRPDFARNVTVAALDSCVIDVGHWWWGEDEKRRAAANTTRLRARAIRRACKAGTGDRDPLMPPAPFEWRWLWDWRKLKLPRRLKLKARKVFDWGKANVVLKRIDWAKLTEGEERQRRFARYLAALIEWTRAYSEEDARRYDSDFPYEWGHALARALGRFAAVHGRGEDWQTLRIFTHHDRAEDLIGDYLYAIAHDLMVSGRAPDERFWAAWKPAAEWILETSIPSRRDHYDHLSEALRAAGFVGPYMTPIPPDWPHLEVLLSWIDGWVSATAHLPSAAYSALVIVERMTPAQRLRWFLPWLKLFVETHGADESFWSYAGLGNKAAALTKPLCAAGSTPRQETRQCLAILADAGSTVAREMLPLFAAKRPSN